MYAKYICPAQPDSVHVRPCRSADLSAQSAESLDIRFLSEEKRVVRAFPVDGQGIGESDVDAVADAFPGQDEFVSLALPAFDDQGVHIYRTCRTVRIELHTLRPSARLARYGLGPCSCQVDFFGLAAYRCGRQHQDKKFFHRDVVLCLFALVVRSGTAVVVRITLSGAKLPNISIGSTDRTGFRSEGLLIL